MFLGLVKNELIKLFSKKKTFIVLGLYILLSIIIAIIGESSEKSYFTYKDPDYLIANVENQISYEIDYQESIKNDTSIDSEEKEQVIKHSNEYIKSLKEKKKTRRK